MFWALDQTIRLRLIETRTFGCGVVLLRCCRRVTGGAMAES